MSAALMIRSIRRHAWFPLACAATVSLLAGCDPAPTAPTKKAEQCYPAAKSRDYGSVSTAAPPYEACAGSLKVHCGGGDGERGGLVGLDLLVEATQEARKTQPDACCYASCD